MLLLSCVMPGQPFFAQQLLLLHAQSSWSNIMRKASAMRNKAARHNSHKAFTAAHAVHDQTGQPCAMLSHTLMDGSLRWHRSDCSSLPSSVLQTHASTPQEDSLAGSILHLRALQPPEFPRWHHSGCC